MDEKLCRSDLFIRWWKPEEWLWPFESFSKLKTTFCKYRTFIKIQISMTCVYKEVHVQWLQLKMTFFWFITRRLLFSRGNELLVGEGNKNLMGDFLGGGMRKCLTCRGLPSSDSLGKTLYHEHKCCWTYTKKRACKFWDSSPKSVKDI